MLITSLKILILKLIHKQIWDSEHRHHLWSKLVQKTDLWRHLLSHSKIVIQNWLLIQQFFPKENL